MSYLDGLRLGKYISPKDLWEVRAKSLKTRAKNRKKRKKKKR